MIKVDVNSANKDFDSFDKKVQKKLIKILDTTVLIVESRAKVKLKTDKHWITGNLASSVHVIKKGDEIPVKLKKMERAVGTNTVYAAKIEFEHDSYLHYANMKERANFQRQVSKAIK